MVKISPVNLLKWRLLFLSCFVVGMLFAQSSRRVHTGKVLVKLQSEISPVVETRLKSRNAADTSAFVSGLSSFDRINRKYQAGNMRRLFPDAGKYEAKHRRYGLHLWYEMSIAEHQDPILAAKEYGLDAHVITAEPAYRIRSSSQPTDTDPWVPNDPNFSKQWHYHNTGQTGGTVGADIRLLKAWKAIDTLGIATGNVVVAVIDGGVYCEHVDLNANMWVNEAERNGITGKDDDGNGYIDDIYGYNFVPRIGSGTIQPEDHATHVTATMAAVTNNNTGVAGMTRNGYGIKVMSVQIMSDNSAVASIVGAFTYAADNGAVIAQNSWGYEDPNSYSQSDVDAINYFIQEAGKDENGQPRPGTPMTGGIVIFAAGNEGTDDKWYPAYFDNVIAVAAVNHYGKRAWYSNYGAWIDIAAPGGDLKEKQAGGIYSASYRSTNKNYYEYMQGTSMACPQVSGVAALILAVYGNKYFTPEMLRARLLYSATPLNTFDSQHYLTMGHGLLNAEKALAAEGLPEKTLDVTATALNHISGELRWTVPTVSKGGSVAYFVTAYAEVELTKDNFDSYAGAPIPSDVATGAQQTHILTELHPNTTYYAAIRSIGNLGEKSEISNVAVFTTAVNRPPEVHALFADTTLIPFKDIRITLPNYFTDPDGDALVFDARLSRTDLVDANVNSTFLTISPKLHGDVMLYITASDPFEASCTANVHIVVEQKYAPTEANELLVYPNPTRDILWYSFTLKDKNASVNVRIVDTAGRILYQTTPIKLNSGTHYFNTNLAAWNSGVYFLQYMINGKPVDTKKILKQD